MTLNQVNKNAGDVNNLLPNATTITPCLPVFDTALGRHRLLPLPIAVGQQFVFTLESGRVVEGVLEKTTVDHVVSIKAANGDLVFVKWGTIEKVESCKAVQYRWF